MISRFTVRDLVIGEFRYCLSYTALLVILLPLESVAIVVTVRVLPLADTTIRPVKRPCRLSCRLRPTYDCLSSCTTEVLKLIAGYGVEFAVALNRQEKTASLF